MTTIINGHQPANRQIDTSRPPQGSGVTSLATSGFHKKIEEAINFHNAEAGSDTPDFILAEFLTNCLAAWDQAVSKREQWYGRDIARDRAERGVVPPTESS